MPADERALAPLYAGGWDAPREMRDRVTGILDDVRARGDAAVVEYTQQFDDPGATVATLRRDVPTRKHARGLVPEADRRGTRTRARTHRRLPRAAEARPTFAIALRDHDANTRFSRAPLHSIGAYVPGGSASLPSTVLMTVVPAKVAGVDRVVVTTPPQRDGSIDPAILYACSLCEVDELYAVGGAQAVGGAGVRHGDDRGRRQDRRPGQRVRHRSEAPSLRRVRDRRARRSIGSAGRVRRARAARIRGRRD